MAGASGFTWKDMLISGFFGNAVEFTDSDGVQWTGRRILAADIQALLDSISSTPGSILVRTASTWAALYPGDPNKVLSIDPATGLPNWLAAPSAGGGGADFTRSDAFAPPRQALNTAIGMTFGNYFARVLWLQAGQIIKSIKFYSTGVVSTTKLTPAIYAQALGVPGAQLAIGAQVIGVVKGIVTLAIDYVAPSDGWYLCGFQVLTTTVNVASGVNIIDQYFFSSSGTLPSTAPAGTFNSGAAWSSFWLSDT
ncbi:MAG TPA: hypothetical protein VLW83_18925 [Candidatus Acidoferrales bacterium]|nr:hypothetical protein [Candidatus Acidoferrales bacterium]